MAQQRRHLMDPTAPRRAPARPGGMSTTTVQRWVMSSLAVTTVLHLVVGIIIASAYVDGARPGATEGLLVIAGLMGMLGIAGAFLIHQRSPLTPWVLAGVVPAVVGALFVL